MFRWISCALFVGASLICSSQIIGDDQAPSADALICEIPVYLDPDGTNNTSGLFVGDIAPDFILYDIENEPYQLTQYLEEKPVLLVSGSYTCPRFRAQLNALEDIVADFSSEIELLIVYCVEAHPFDDISPYFGYVNPANNNTIQGIIYNQPVTYSDRLEVVGDMLNNIDIPGPVLLDTPCNEWWDVYGPAENNAYLIDQNGEIVVKHGWLNNFGLNMYNDIEAWLSGEPFESETYSGEFTVVSAETTGTELNDGLHLANAEISNSSNSPVAIDIIRTVESAPDLWGFSICSGICFNPTIDSIRIAVPAGDDLDLTMYAYPNGVPGDAWLHVEIKNAFIESNVYEWDIDFNSNITSVDAPLPTESDFYISNGRLYFDANVTRIELYSLNGALQSHAAGNSIPIDSIKDALILVRYLQGETWSQFKLHTAAFAK